MKLDLNGYKLIQEFEGLSLKVYLDSVNVPTIGYGTTYYENGTRVTIHDAVITKERAFELLKINADRFAVKVSNLVHKPINQNQFNSLVSFTYNLGSGAFASSTLLKKVNINPNDNLIRLEFLKWNRAGGKILSGLIKRRNKESELYFT